MSGKNSTIKKIGIIGGGRMGCGIVNVFALSGHNVHLLDTGKARLAQADKYLEEIFAHQIAKKRITPADRAQAVKRIKTGVNIQQMKVCDLVIEAVTEDERLKRTLLKRLCPHLKANAIIASNTSSISITRLAAATDRPGKFIGMHFMNPAPVMKLVELIRGIATDEETYRAVWDLTLEIGKTPVMTEDFPAFIVNRILLPMVNEAVYTLYEGVGSVEAIDTAIKLGANHPLGPLELADYIGLDICLAIMNVLYEGLADNKYRPCPLLVKYVEAGWLGRKTKRGFYDYTSGKPVPTR